MSQGRRASGRGRTLRAARPMILTDRMVRCDAVLAVGGALHGTLGLW